MALYRRFTRSRREPTRIVALIPADGWRVRWDSVDASWPLVGWGLREDGRIIPLGANGDGIVEQVLPTQYDRVVAAARGTYRNQPPGAPTWDAVGSSQRLDLSYHHWRLSIELEAAPAVRSAPAARDES